MDVLSCGLPTTAKINEHNKVAFRIYKRLKNKTTSEMTNKEKSSFKWARRQVQLIQSSDSPPKKTSKVMLRAKKRRLRRRRQRNGHRQSFKINEDRLPQESIVLAIVDASKNNGTISPENWKSVESALLEIYPTILRNNPGSSPKCRDMGWFCGCIKVIACWNQRSAYLYELALKSLGEIWPGAKLRAIPKHQIPTRPKCETWIPYEMSTKEGILQMIQVSNPRLPTEDWKILKISDSINLLRRVQILLNEESLEILPLTKYEINYGFSSIHLLINEVNVIDVTKFQPMFNRLNNSNKPYFRQPFEEESQDFYGSDEEEEQMSRAIIKMVENYYPPWMIYG